MEKFEGKISSMFFNDGIKLQKMNFEDKESWGTVLSM
jgi:hypothetical protein